MNLLKPWFVFRPQQLLLRILRQFYLPAEAVVRLPWGLPLAIRPRMAIGRAIWHTGLYDLAVTEALHRLVMPGAVCLDVGANIGCLTGLMALRAGSAGSVTAFEPFESSHRQLVHNLRLAESAVKTLAPVTVHRLGLSDHTGTASLVFEDVEKNVDVQVNEGTPYVGAATDSNRAVPIEISRLDDVLGAAKVDVMKLDVEGHELAVLHGASAALAGCRITSIVFEDHATGPRSPVRALLEEAGYQIRRLAWTLAGPGLLASDEEEVPHRQESPNYLATLDPQVLPRLEAPGWQCLKAA
ncbi:FkbM family methyltransferase [Prosthecobacter sp.]|uniref:FkbM family methyltransferase n=1 Tax=Prosthecobacter sp. TaxID=1965333 RepID=UPI002AB9AF29|nr:FkbM family methyltransferase [Prosthecobacter sp.]MDZ4404120.1 FkbM family methyltransferase [Prosthecobacter sp.]